MAACEAWENDHDGASTVTTADGGKRVFDRFKCAAQASASACARCGCGCEARARHGAESGSAEHAGIS